MTISLLSHVPELLVLATEAGISDWRAYAAVPLGVLFFLGSGYWILRSNLGTKRAYLVMANLILGFLVLLSLFWAFGAPGTPAAIGPTNLPGQPADEYQPVWTAFAEDSLIAESQAYNFITEQEANFSDEPPPEIGEGIDAGITSIVGLFSSEEGGQRIGATWAPLPDSVGYAVSPESGYPVIRVTFQETYQLDADGEIPDDAGAGFTDVEQVGTVDPDGETFTAFAYFDAGWPSFPALLICGIALVLWLLHIWLLAMDERAERRERLAVTSDPERVPAGV